jgi:hypothetical protein
MKPPFDVLINPEGTEAVIRLRENEVRVSAEGLENAIAWLGLLRSKMKPAVPTALPQNPQLLPLSDFLFVPLAADAVPNTNGVALHVRSGYFGWFQLRLSPEHCQHLASWLSGQPVGAPKGATLN